MSIATGAGAARNGTADRIAAALPCAGVSPDVLAAWVHHRFTQIHPFQDGNGRVARLLATLIFIRAEWLPLVVGRDDRVRYLDAFEAADKGEFLPLVAFFDTLQRVGFHAGTQRRGAGDPRAGRARGRPRFDPGSICCPRRGHQQRA